jgi:hypothetical protein
MLRGGNAPAPGSQHLKLNRSNNPWIGRQISITLNNAANPDFRARSPQVVLVEQ